MRKITEQAVTAFWNGYSFSKGNTFVAVDGGTVLFYLHGNLIAKRVDDKLMITAANWETNTTKERLNGILSQITDLRIRQIDFSWFLVDDNGNKLPFELIDGKFIPIRLWKITDLYAFTHFTGIAKDIPTYQS